MSATDYRCKTDKVATVPRIVHELVKANYKRKIKRLTKALITSVTATTCITIGVIIYGQRAKENS